jgi:sodium pump decarboxylase gamma subunit
MQGVVLLVVGMAILFAAMGVLILVMVVLERVFRSRPQALSEQESEEKALKSRSRRDTEDEEVVAAIAAALAHLRSLDMGRSGLGRALEVGRGSWWAMGRAQQRLVQTPLHFESPPQPRASTPSRTEPLRGAQRKS